MIVPLQQDDAFLADVGQTGGGGLHLWWVGQSGFLVRWHDAFLLFDPYLSDSLTRKYAQTDKPHVRLTARVIDPARLGFVSVVTCTHAHTDHLDADTLRPLFAANPAARLILPRAILPIARERLGERGEAFVAMSDGESATVGPFHIRAVTAAHNTVDRDADGNALYLGFVVTIGPWVLYHSGDTLWHEGLEEQLRPLGIHVALLPINGNRPERRVSGNLDGHEAAALAKAIGARLAVPCHYEMFDFNTALPQLFQASCVALGQPYRVLRAGERLSLHE